jgi:hypothetical protein
MRFDVAGPFELRRYGKKKIITNESMTALKPQLENWSPGLSKACGCYIFAIRAGKGYTPYYVGQACKRSLLLEALNPSNIQKFNTACSESKGMPVVFFLPMRTPTGRYRKKGGGRGSLGFLEQWLIAAAIEKNRNGLINTRETHFLRKITVVGIFNAKRGEATSASRKLRKALW